MALYNGRTYVPLFLTFENKIMYFHVDSQGCALFSEDSPEPFYRIQEPLLLAQGIMTDPNTVHLLVLKTNGELCCTLISGDSTPQTMLIAKLDVNTAKYCRFFFFPQGKIIHIFYAYSQQTMQHLWRIEHRFWDGTSWHSIHLGEISHPREPLYHVNLDNKGNIHLLTMTFNGQHSFLFTNRFNGTFHIWGSPTEILKIPGKVADMTALMTSDNAHHVFWVVNTNNGKSELHSALQTDTLNLTSTWQPLSVPIKTFASPLKGIGALEANGVPWLLAHTNEEILMHNDSKGWHLVSSCPSLNQPLYWVHKGKRNSHHTYWLEDQARRIPAYYSELGLKAIEQDPNKQNPPLSVASQPAADQAPSPVPAFYPELLSPSLLRQNLTAENESNILNHSVTKEHDKLHLNLSLTLEKLLSKFDQILQAISENAIRFKPEAPYSAPPEEPEHENIATQTPPEEIEPLKEALSNLENENKSLSQALRMMLNKQEESDSSIDKLEIMISQLQAEKEDAKDKGGFWNKWFS